MCDEVLVGSAEVKTVVVNALSMQIADGFESVDANQVQLHE